MATVQRASAVSARDTVPRSVGAGRTGTSRTPSLARNTVSVPDPACGSGSGSGNFLYVTLEHLKRLEGEVLNQMAELSDGPQKLETEGLTVDPHQFLGLELNPRAAALAELVLWIGYLQWHFRTRGDATPPLPVLKDFRTIECRDAVLAHDGMSYAVDAHGKPITRWDGRTFKAHPVTGEQVPDEAAQTALETFANPRPAEWPQADFVVSNPPFIGASTPAPRAGRWLCRSAAQGLAAGAGECGPCDALVAACGRPHAQRRAAALWADYRQQHSADV